MERRIHFFRSGVAAARIRCRVTHPSPDDGLPPVAAQTAAKTKRKVVSSFNPTIHTS